MPQKAQSHCESSKTSDRCRLSGAQLQCSARRLRTQMVQPSMKAKHKRRAVSLGRSFLLHEWTFSKTFEDLRASTLRSSPWERIPRVIPVYLLASQRSKIRQSSLSCPLILCAHPTNDVVCGLPPRMNSPREWHYQLLSAHTPTGGCSRSKTHKLAQGEVIEIPPSCKGQARESQVGGLCSCSRIFRLWNTRGLLVWDYCTTTTGRRQRHPFSWDTRFLHSFWE